jgi:hypothetical protein
VKAKLLSPLLNLGHQPAHHLIEEDSTSSKNSVSSATTTKQGRVLGGLGTSSVNPSNPKKKDGGEDSRKDFVGDWASAQMDACPAEFSSDEKISKCNDITYCFRDQAAGRKKRMCCC